MWTVSEFSEHSYRFWNTGSGRGPSGARLGKTYRKPGQDLQGIFFCLVFVLGL